MVTKKDTTAKINNYQKILAVCFLLILALMPFHGLLSLSIGKLSSQQALVQAWKEILIVIMLAVAAIGLFKKRLKIPKLDWTNKTAIIIIGLATIYIVFSPTTLSPMLFGLKTDIVPILLFLLAQFAAPALNQKKLIKFLLLPAALVAILAILQVTLIPSSWLLVIGYGPTTINPLQLVDPALQLVRAFASLGGPNQLGAYMILPLCLSLVLSVRNKDWRFGLLTLLFAAALALSFSRSAWIGGLIAAAISIFLLLRGRVRWLFSIFVVLAVIISVMVINPILNSSTNSTAQYLLLHGRVFDSKVEGSDSNRITSAAVAVELARRHPFGLGLGSAGPASYRASTPIISENWYIQIVLELGWFGLAAFIAFFVCNGLWLWRSARSKNLLSIALLAALIGLSITNLFLHTWADSTLALIFMATLGLQKGMSS